MTISYQCDVRNASVISFCRILFRWKGSIWKAVVFELTIWSLLYASVSVFYRSNWFLNAKQKRGFAEVAHLIRRHMNLFPITFILGFYVSAVAKRWVDMIRNMGYVDNLALLIGNYIRGEDEYARLMRRAMVRWICLSQVLVYRDINIGVRKRFPTLESIVKAGFMLENEKRKLEALKLDYDKYWVPINWAYTLNFEARKKEMCTRDVLTNKINDELKVFRTSLQTLCNYDWVPLPLAYPQMISFAIYSYFAFCLFAQQYLAAGRTEGVIDRIDMYVPWITMLQFIFYVGWTKCAVALMNPMGEDDDDFECNYLLDMNLATALCIADVTRNDYAPVKPDKFWLLGEVEAFYPENTSDSDVGLLHGSAIDARIDTKDSRMVVRRSLGTTGGVQNSGPSHSLNTANFHELTASKRRKKFSESHLMASKKSSIAGEQQPRRAFSCAVDGLNVDASHNGPLNKGRRLSTAKTIDVPTSALWKDEADDE